MIHSQVLPGFQFRLVDLYRQPEPPALIEDPVSSSFVSPFVRAERLRAEQARVRAEAATQQAQQERERADR